MSIDNQYVVALIDLLSRTKKEEADCGTCIQHLSEFAEVHLAGKSIREGLLNIEEHLSNCGECREEFEALKAALASDELEQ